MSRIIGAQMYTIRDYVKTNEGIDSSFAKLKEIGYTHGQRSAFNADPHFIKEMCDKHDFKITSSHGNFDEMYANIDKHIADHKVYGCRMPGIGGLPQQYRETKEGILTFVKRASEIADKMAAEGQIFTYHNHAFEFVKVDGKYIMDYILEECSENVKLMVDVYWLSVAGINPVDFLKKNASRVGAVHYKDLKVVDNAPEMCEVGYGNLDWDKIIACCDELNPEFIFVEQDRNFDNPFDSLKMSYDFLKAKGYK